MSSSYRLAYAIVRNDLRLTYRDWRARKFGALLGISLLSLLLLLLIAASCFLFLSLPRPPDIFVQGLVWGVAAFMMFGSAVSQSVTLLCERADFDLLISSPVPARVLLLARMVSVVVASLVGASLLVVPYVVGLTVGKGPHYLAGIPVWILVGVVVSSLSMSFGLGLVRLLGIRRARVTIQIFGALVGASAYLATQAHHLVDVADSSAAARWLEVSLHIASLGTVAQAARGDLLPLAGLSGLALAAGAGGVWVLGRTFLRGTQEGGEKASRRAAGGALRFRTQLTWATVRKDTRLILRDPLLLTQILPPLLYMVPGVFALTKHPDFNTVAPLALAVTLQTAGSLAVVAAHGEEGWDLIRMSPTAEVRLRLGKAIAAVVGPALLAVIFAGVQLVQGHWFLAPLTWVVAVANGYAMAWVNVSRVEARPRGTVQGQVKRRSAGIAGTIAAIALLLTGSFGLAAVSHPELFLRVFGIAALGVNALVVVCCVVLVEPKEATFAEERATA